MELQTFLKNQIPGMKLKGKYNTYEFLYSEEEDGIITLSFKTTEDFYVRYRIIFNEYNYLKYGHCEFQLETDIMIDSEYDNYNYIFEWIISKDSIVEDELDAMCEHLYNQVGENFPQNFNSMIGLVRVYEEQIKKGNNDVKTS